MRVPALEYVIVFVTAVCAAGCGSASSGSAPPVIQPGAPGQADKVLTADTASALPQPKFSPADVTFMQGMIHHHSQAIDMVELLYQRTASDDMRKLAKRIEVSQNDELGMMRRWLEARGQEVPGPHAHHMPGAPLMPGMLTPDEMAKLATVKGPEFDRLFLEGMIKHHSGALTMVADLFATAGAAQGSEIFAFASDVDADQRMEIDRMSAMLKELQK
ncbi:MAG TPA: DUF305 domain-containing protein [Vicinamibacterales bacterium]|nr:DUF305 domain-containing protein [Vicinamibacterales bacterium]